MTGFEPAGYGALKPGWLDRAVLAATTRLPNSWLGLRLAILLRRATTNRLSYPDGALDVERWGMRLRLHPRDNGCEKNLLFTPRMYEPIELREIAADVAHVGARDEPYTFVDIGANVGLFSIFVAAQTRSRARILAIEPEPGNLHRLDFNVQANPAVPITIIRTALNDRAGEVGIERNRCDRGGSRTVAHSSAQTSSDVTPVSAQPLLDVVLAQNIDAIDALKIDVEGIEDAILAPFFRDAPASLRPRLIIVEDSQASWSIDLMALLSANGYAVVARSKQNLVLRRTGRP